MKTAKHILLMAAWIVLGLQASSAQSTHDAGVTQILSVPFMANIGQPYPFEVVVQNFGTDTIYFMHIAYDVDSSSTVTIPWNGVLPPQTTDTVSMPALIMSAMGNPVLCARTILPGDTNYSNDESCFSFWSMYIHDMSVTRVTRPESGCALGMDSITIWVKNLGMTDSLNYPNPSNITVSYRIEGQPTVVTESFTSFLGHLDSTYHHFSTPADFGVTTQTDTFRITAWVNHPGDYNPSNDTAYGEVISVHTPAAPFVYDTIIPYGTSVTLPAVSPDMVQWYSTDTSTTPLHTGPTYTTPILFDTTTYWVEAVAGLPGGPSYPNGCTGPRVPLNVSTMGLPVCDVGIIALVQPVTTTLLGSQEDVTIIVNNFGTAMQQNIPVSYQIDNQPPVTETITAILPPGFFLYYTFNAKADLSIVGHTYQLKAWTSLPCDIFFANDSIFASVTNQPPAYCQSTATLSSNTEITNVSIGTVLNNSSTPSGAMYSDYTGTVAPAVLSPGVNYTMTITTDYAPGSSSNSTCHVKAWIDFDQDGVFDPVNELVFEQITSSSNTVNAMIAIPPTAITGYTVMRVVHQVTSNPADVLPCGTYSMGETEDYLVMITPQAACDAGAIQIASPGTVVQSGVPQPVWVRFMNFGYNHIAPGSLSVSYQLNNDPPVTVPYPSGLSPYNIDSIWLPPATFQNGQNTLCAYTTLACDSNPFNDTVCINVFGQFTTTIPFFDDFEGGNFWYTSANAVNWQLGDPSGSIINTAYSPTNAWVTNLSGHYINYADEYLYSPFFDFSGFAGFDTVRLSFYHYLATQPGDFGRVQYSVNGGQTWANLGFHTDPLGTNWYNVVTGGQHYFSHQDTGWMESSYRLPPSTFNGQPQVQFRFHFVSTASGTSEGWAIDDFRLSLPPPNMVVVSDILFPVQDTIPGTPIYPVVRLRNQSSNTFTMIPLEVRINGLLVNSGLWTGSLPPGDSTTYSFTSPYTVPVGPYQLCINTDIMFPSPPMSTVYCRNFTGLPIPPNHGYLHGLLTTPTGAAGPSEVWLIQYDSLTGILSALDTVLSQDSAGVTTYHFSQVPPGNYLVKAALLPVNPGYASHIPSYHQSSLFWHQADTIQVTAGNIHQASVEFIQGINPGGPGFIGGLVTQGANKAPGDPIEGVIVLLLDELNGGQPVAYDVSGIDGRFGFSNIPLGTYSVYAEVPGKLTTPPVVSIDANNPIHDKVEIVVGSNIVFYVRHTTKSLADLIGNPYPNPANEWFRVPVRFRENTTLITTLSDLAGRRVYEEVQYLTSGEVEMTIDVSALQAGVYFFTVTTDDGASITRKLVKHTP